MSEELNAVPKKGMSKGCLIGLVVVGILAIIVIGSGIVCYVYQDELLEYGLDKSTDMIALEIKANLPEEFTEAEIDELFDKLKQAIKNKEINPESIQKLVMQFQSYLEDQKIDMDEARKLIEEIKETIEY
ncbi:MAG: hypothetical protein GY865_14800 [candidate division Zixibacteria bacterium]|nr:hypothetical protein [candidate division Zixibacteria bacterium]